MTMSEMKTAMKMTSISSLPAMTAKDMIVERCDV
jgi:hypothetical protein